MPFAADIVEDLLVKSARCCCLCRQFKGQKIEIHHVIPEAKGGPSTRANAIPLCFDCHADVESYNDKHPRGRKYRPAELKRLRDEWLKLVATGKIGGQGAAELKDDDRELIQFYSQCLDRPAFQDETRREGSIEDFDKAVEDTITAFNTGCLQSRAGRVLASARGKSFLENTEWRQTADTIVDLLRAMRSRYAAGVRIGQIHLGPIVPDGSRFYDFRDGELATWFDMTKAEVVRLFNTLAERADVPTLNFPRHHHRHW